MRTSISLKRGVEKERPAHWVKNKGKKCASLQSEGWQGGRAEGYRIIWGERSR